MEPSNSSINQATRSVGTTLSTNNQKRFCRFNLAQKSSNDSVDCGYGGFSHHSLVVVARQSPHTDSAALFTNPDTLARRPLVFLQGLFVQWGQIRGVASAG